MVRRDQKMQLVTRQKEREEFNEVTKTIILKIGGPSTRGPSWEKGRRMGFGRQQEKTLHQAP